MSARPQLFAGFLIVFLLTSVNQTNAEEEDRTLLVQLGHADFAQRVAAERIILEQGARNLDLVRAGIASEDAEVRRRCQRLLKILQRMAVADSRDAVQADPWQAQAELTPAWETFQSIAGDGPEARRLYVEMIDAESGLLLAVNSSTGKWQSIFETRCAALRTFADPRPNQMLPAPTVCTLLLLAVHTDAQPSQDATNLISSLLSTSAFSRHVEESSQGAAIRSLIDSWLCSCRETISAHHRLALAKTFGVPAGLAAAREILGNRQGLGRSRMQVHEAIRFLTRHGGTDAIPDLHAFLVETQSPIGPLVATATLPHRSETDRSTDRYQDAYARDLALWGLLSLTGQSAHEYGMLNAQSENDVRFENASLTFASDVDRAAAYAKWRQWWGLHAQSAQLPPRDASAGELL